MRLITKSILVGIGTLALAGGASAAERAFHTLNVQLPDGSVEHINYVGDQPPEVRIVPVSAAAPAIPVAWFDPVAFGPIGFGPIAFGPAADPSFAAFDQMFRAMDAHADAMMRQAATLAQMPVMADGKVDQAALRSLPAGTVSYSFVSTTTGNGSCTRSVQMTSYDGKAEPKVVSQTTGDCSALSKPVKRTSAPGKAAPAVPPAPKTVGHDIA